ncbi:MAG TPA: hypothetical protein VIS99_06630 [Terrimicrobiaceae bacterium]
MRTLKDKLNNLNPQRREKVEARAAQLIAQEMTSGTYDCEPVLLSGIAEEEEPGATPKKPSRGGQEGIVTKPEKFA